MQDLKKQLRRMSQIILDMVGLVYQGLMENDTRYLDSALNKEQAVDDMAKDVMYAISGASKSAGEKDRKEFVLLGQAAQNIARMGDELRYLMERIEIKIEEDLFFSDIAVEQYKEVFEVMQKSVKITADFLEREDGGLLDAVISNGDGIKALIEKYRAEHIERLTKGICQPRAANIFFDMLDFTGNVARHCTNIARIHKGR